MCMCVTRYLYSYKVNIHYSGPLLVTVYSSIYNSIFVTHRK